MIRTFSVENFCSFRNPSQVSFVVGKSAPDNTTFRESVNPNDRLSVLLGAFGPNASGKTNLVKGLAFISYFLHDSYNATPEEPIPVDGFLPLGSDVPTAISLEFEAEGTVFQYKAQLTTFSVITETLSMRGKETGRFSTMLSRQETGDGKKPDITIAEELDIPKAVILNTLRPNASIVATALQSGNQALASWITPLKVATNVRRFGRSSTWDIQRLHTATAFFHKEQALFAQVRDLLPHGDLGIKDIQITEKMDLEETTGKEVKQLSTEVTHPAGDLPDFVLPMLLESSGTKRLFILLSWLLPALRDGRPAVIDEMESDLHPHILPWILRLFTTPVLNPRNAQLLFTCHSVEILNELDKTQIYLVGKDPEDCVSVATRLDDIKGVRRDDNILAKYNAGIYGAVPELE
jgi:uncharacterized protein